MGGCQRLGEEPSGRPEVAFLEGQTKALSVQRLRATGQKPMEQDRTALEQETGVPMVLCKVLIDSTGVNIQHTAYSVKNQYYTSIQYSCLPCTSNAVDW